MPPVPAALTRPRAALAAVALIMGLTLTVATLPAAAQVPPTTAPGGVLVPGTTTPAGAPTTTAPPTSTSAPAEDEGGLLDFDANEKVWIIVGALVVVSLLLLVLTILYWRHTRPDREAKAAHKEAKAEARADAKAQRRVRRADPGPNGDGADGSDPEERPAASDGPMDLDELLGSPDPSRSIFGDPDPPSR